MKCPLCRIGTTIPGTGDKVISHQGTTLVVKGTPADVCDTCGERYHDADVAAELLRIAAAAADAGVLVDVRRYSAAA